MLPPGFPVSYLGPGQTGLPGETTEGPGVTGRIRLGG